MRSPRCFLCERPIMVIPGRGWRNWVCDECATAYDLRKPISEWPGWARKFCGRFERHERKQDDAGIEFVPLPDDDCD